MESSKVLGGSEEGSSSESGWTMYIDSPVHEDHSYYENNDLESGNNKNAYSDKSDDSMASDASSGPSHQKLPSGSTKGSQHVLGHFKQSADNWEDRRSKCCSSSGKKPHKQAEKKTHEKRTKAEKQLPGHNPNSDAGHGQTGAKVRKPKKEKK